MTLGVGTGRNSIQSRLLVQRENSKYTLVSVRETIRDAHPKRMVFPIVEDKPRPRIIARASTRPIGRRWGNCVYYLRSKGYFVPQNPRIYARTLPVVSNKLPPEGKIVVAVTYEGKSGHVVATMNKGGKLIVVDDSLNRKGQEIPKRLYKGFI